MISFKKFITKENISVFLAVGGIWGGIWFVVDMNLNNVRQSIDLVRQSIDLVNTNMNINVKRIEDNMVTTESLKILQLELTAEFKKTLGEVTNTSFGANASADLPIQPEDK